MQKAGSLPLIGAGRILPKQVKVITMKFMSTQNHAVQKTLASALREGLAADGGLYIPTQIPQLTLADFSPTTPYPQFAAQVLKPFFMGSELGSALPMLCQRALDFPIPLNILVQNTFMLELFHGPTLSFKDVGARFLAECLCALPSSRKMTILVTTSGDTGSAAAAAFYRKKNIDVIILYPKGQISARQQHQITCWGENIFTLAVEGTFDDCQRLVKSAFSDPKWRHFNLCTANSINIGRLLPQITYYAYTSLKFYCDQGGAESLGYIIPTGNLGNATAAYWAMTMGFPIREIVLATNANCVISDYLISGHYKPRPSISTLANAMDVGKPSNFERLQALYPSFTTFQNKVRAFSVSDEEIKATIERFYQKYQLIICPHTATAGFVRGQVSGDPWAIVATADPCKFETVIEPLLQQAPPLSPSMQTLLARPTFYQEVGNDLEAIREKAERYF